jgi:hypothetical protein
LLITSLISNRVSLVRNIGDTGTPGQ